MAHRSNETSAYRNTIPEANAAAILDQLPRQYDIGDALHRIRIISALERAFLGQSPNNEIDAIEQNILKALELKPGNAGEAAQLITLIHIIFPIVEDRLAGRSITDPEADPAMLASQLKEPAEKERVVAEAGIMEPVNAEQYELIVNHAIR